MPGSLYDIYLGDIASLQGYRCRSFVRDSAPLVAARFSSSQQGQSDLDLLKSASVDSLAGGMFQRDHTDPDRVARAIGVFNKQDENLYPVPPFVSMTITGTAPATSYALVAKAESDLYTFLMYSSTSTGNVFARLYKITKSSGVMVEITTVPAAIANSTTGVSGPTTSMVFHKGYLFVAGATTNTALGSHFNNYRYNISADTWQDIGSYGVLFFQMRNSLYLVGTNSDVLSVTNETIAGNSTNTTLDNIGINDTANGYATDAVEFNGAGWIAKPEGLYRFDGVKAVKVLNLACRYLTVFNGALYFVSRSWLYKFDGTNVTKLQFFGTVESITGMTATPDYLVFATGTILTGSYVTGDNQNTWVSGNAQVRVYTYDGASFYIVHEANYAYLDTKAWNPTPAYVGNRLMLIVQNSTANYLTLDLNKIFDTTQTTTTSVLDITTSEFNDGFPNVLKSLELLDLNYSGLTSTDSLAVKYQLYDGKTWSSWYTAGTITASTSNTIEITDSSKKLFRRMKISVVATLTAASLFNFKGVSWRYTLQPRMRWRWQTLVMAEGNSTTTDRAGSLITNDANELANVITKAVKQKTPTFLLAPDYGAVKTGVNSSALSFIVKGRPAIYTDPYNEYPLIAVKNSNSVWEVLRVSAASYDAGADETTITVLERGYYGVTAASISTGAEVRLAYKVYVTRLLRDAPVLDDNTYNEQPTTGESQLQREFNIELTEV